MSDQKDTRVLESWTDVYKAMSEEAVRQRLTYKPPSDDELEQKLLGAMLITDVDFPGCLNPAHFVDPVHRIIFEMMQRCLAEGELVNQYSIAGRLQNNPALEEVGGTAYLEKLANLALDDLPSVALGSESPGARIERMAATVSELAHARRLLVHMDDLRAILLVHQEQLFEPSPGQGFGRDRAHALAMDLTGLVRDVLDRSLGWA